MTKDELKTRGEMLQQALLQTQANYNEIIGRINENKAMIEEIEAKEKAELGKLLPENAS